MREEWQSERTGRPQGRENELRYAANLLLELAKVGASRNGTRIDMDSEGLRLGQTVLANRGTLASVFDAVSLRRETISRKFDGHGRFDEAAVSWGCSDPWVSRLAQKLSKDLAAAGEAEMVPLRELRVIVTHDVDRVTPSEPASILKAISRYVGAHPASWLRFSEVVKPRLFLRNLERMLDLELRYGVRPWFFMLAGHYGFSRYSNRYGIRWRLARETIRLIKEAGGEIGLHGSYHARERDSYRAEASLLTEMTGRPVIAHRNHYLRFDSRKIWSQLERASIRFDFSLGLTTGMGFRVPISGPFHPYDWEAAKTSLVEAVPTIAMDKPWWPDRQEEVLDELKVLLRAAREVGGVVAILTHPEMAAVDRRWFDFMTAVFEFCVELGARLDGVLPQVGKVDVLDRTPL